MKTPHARLSAEQLDTEAGKPPCATGVWSALQLEPYLGDGSHTGLHSHQTRTQDHSPTQEEIAETNSKTFHYLEKARLGEVRFFYLDETPATMWSTLSYVRARKGTRPEVPMADDHGVYVFSAADPLSGKVHYRIAPTPHREDVLAFLEQMRSRYPIDKIVFRLDNYPSAHIVTQFAEEDGNMQLEHLNRYTSFKCNPIERLFKWFRRVVTHNQFFKSITDLKSAIRAFFRSVANQPRRIVSLLRLNLNSFP